MEKVYIPPNAMLNVDEIPLSPPKTKYEHTRETFDRDKVNKVVKGKYGKHEPNIDRPTGL